MLDLRRIIRSFFSAAFMRLVSAGLSFVFFVLLARARGDVVLGEFSTVLAFFIFFQSLPLLGLHIALVRDVSADHGSLPRLGANAAVLGLAASIPCALAIGLAGTAFYPPATHAAFWLTALSIVPSALIVVSESLLTAQERVDVVAALSVGENLARLLLWMAVLWAGLSTTAFFAALLAGRIGAVAAHYRWGRLRPLADRRLLDTGVLRHLLALCPTFLAILLLAAGVNRLDFLMLSKLGTLKDVGLYAAAYKVYEMALMVPQLLSVALYPALSRAIQRSPEASGDLVRKVFRIYTLLGIPCAVLLLYASRTLVATIYGHGFDPAHVALKWLIVAPLLAALDQVLTTVLFANHRQGLDLKVLIVSCSTYAVLLSVLIPLYGFEGAAVATLMVAGLQVGFRYWLVRTRLGMRGLLSTLVRPVAAAGVMAGVCYVASALPLAAVIVVGLAAYAVALPALGAFSMSELRGLKSALGAGAAS
jgi:O-antigen/teichoic acid export membrane protein